ncbi:hypothetical protein C8Q74DRAFT_459678 [Fomes fomentarius]|nr:hypothetical protein C8Q74DRAFT_459678 [Fomes fomentarius]
MRAILNSSTSIVHFRRFLDALEGRRVDMSKIEISKAELALWGYVTEIACRQPPKLIIISIEHLNKFKKRQAALLNDAKEDAHTVGKHIRGAMPHRDHGYWKREILEGRKRSQMSRPEDESRNKEISGDNQIPHAATRQRPAQEQSSKGENGAHDAG